MKEEIFKYKKTNFEKLISYGFLKNKNIYNYSIPFIQGDFVLNIEISKEGKFKTELIEKETKEPYSLHLTDAKGIFVGEIRDEYYKILEDIEKNCFEISVFKSEYAYKIIKYIKKKYGDEIEYLWEKFPDNGIARRKDNSKWYLAILTVKKCKLGFEGDEKVEVIDLRAESQKIPELLKNDNIFAGYHMNKKHWISIILDGSMPIKEVYNFIDKSYILAKK